MLVALRVKIDFECQIILKRFGREMDGDNDNDNDNVNASLLSLDGSCIASACFRDALGRHQASRRHRSGISNPLACDHGERSPDGHGYRDGEHWKHRVLLSENTISVPDSETPPI